MRRGNSDEYLFEDASPTEWQMNIYRGLNHVGARASILIDASQLIYLDACEFFNVCHKRDRLSVPERVFNLKKI